MELPDDVLKIIKDYSMPINRPDWRKGCYFNRYPFNINNTLFTFKYMLRLLYNIHKGEIHNLLMNMMLVELMIMMNNE